MLENFGKFDKISVDFDSNVTYLIGPNGSGKSTLGHTAVQFIFEGIAEKAKSKEKHPIIGERFRFIGDRSNYAKGILVLHDEEINKDIVIKRKMDEKGSEVTFEAPLGMELNQDWLSNLFNVFFLSPKYFESISSEEQAIVLGIDVLDIDKQIETIKQEYTLINRDYKNIGELNEIEKTETVSLSDLLKKAEEIRKHNNEIEERDDTIKDYNEELHDIELQVNTLKERYKKIKEAYTTLSTDTRIKQDITPILNKINEVETINSKAIQYKEYLNKKSQRESLFKQMSSNRDNLAKAQEKRTNRVKNMKLPYDNMSIDESGKLLLDGKPIKSPYFSTGELKLIEITLISQMNPELRYLYLQDFNLLDENKQKEIINFAKAKDLQLVIEYVTSEEKRSLPNMIVLKDCQIVE